MAEKFSFTDTRTEISQTSVYGVLQIVMCRSEAWYIVIYVRNDGCNGTKH